ncbi:MAG: Uma2 family endonuclease [Hyphomicrobiaceae bacterium]
MNAPIATRLTIAQFHAWLDSRHAALAYDESKWELFDGVPEMQASERWVHVRTKVTIMLALRGAIARAGLPLEVGMDGLGVQIGSEEEYVPEVVVFPAGKIADHDRIAPDPIVVVEVLSPSSLNKDLRIKAVGYARVPTIAHYLVVDPDTCALLHFRRAGEAFLLPDKPLTEGVLRLDPPGLDVPIAEFFGMV